MPTLYIIRPDGIDVDSVNWTASVGLKYNCINDSQDSTFITSAVPLDPITFTCAAPTVAGNVGVERVVVKARISGDNTGAFGIRARFNSTNVNQTRANFTTETSRTAVDVEYDITFLRPGGGQWIVDDLGNLNIGIHEANWSGGGGLQVYVLEMWVEYYVGETPVQLPAAREVPSRILRQRRTTRDDVSGQVPPEFLDLELMTDFNVIHADAPTEDGLGYQEALGKRGLFRLSGIELDMNAPLGDNFVATIEGEGLRHYGVHLWDPAHARTAGPLQDGCALLDGGQARTYNRDSPVYVPDPSDGRVVPVQFDNETLVSGGRFYEREIKNYLPASSFRDGALGYTDVNNANVSKTTVQYSDWDTSVLHATETTRYYTLFEILNNALAGARQFPTTDSIPANTTICLSIDFRYDVASGTNGPGYYALQRAVDGWWYNATLGAWQAGGVRNRIGATSPTVTKRRFEGLIKIGTNATTVDLYVGLLESETVGSKMRLYHAQIEATVAGGATGSPTYASSRIVTGYLASATRGAATLNYTNNSGNRIWPAAGGTLSARITAPWSFGSTPFGSVSGAERKTVVYVYHDANNYAWVYYFRDASPGVASTWRFEQCVGGVLYTATHPTGDGTIAVRWTSAAGENGLAPYTMSFFVDGSGLLQVNALPGAPMTEVASSNLYIGHKNGVDFLDGAISDLEITPFVLSDIEIQRLAL